MAMFIAIFAFIIILCVGAGAAILIGKNQDKRARYESVVMRSLGGGGSASESAKDKQTARARAEISRKLKEAGNESKKKKSDRASIRELMMQAGIEAPVSRYWIGSVIFAVVVWSMLTLFFNWPPIAVIFATFTAFIGMPKMFLKMRAAKRQRKFLEEFPDALDASVRLLQAGMPISEAIAMASREFTGPLKEEMLRIFQNQKIGVPLGQAALDTAKRIPLTEVHMFATALQIQSETGSSLSEVLSNLSHVIRARYRLKRKVKALSSEAKASAAIIAALPPLVSFGLYCVNPNYIAILFETTKGNLYLYGAIFWMFIGVMIMRLMINFKV